MSANNHRHHHHHHPIMRAMRHGLPSRNLERLFFVLAMFAFIGTFRLHKTALDLNHLSNNDGSSSLLSSSWAFYWTSSSSSSSRQREIPAYIAAPLEEALMQNLDLLGYNTGNTRNASGCAIWHLHHQQQQQQQQHANDAATTAKLVRLSKDLNIFRSELSRYTQVVRDFAGIEGDLRLRLTDNDQINHEICKIVDLHPQGLKGLFPSGQLSLSSSGFVEPLFPPMRHAEFCFHNESGGLGNNSDTDNNNETSLYPNYEHLMNPEYIIHDFGAMCRKLKKTSRIILVDMGASLDFHGDPLESPVMFLIQLFYKFGFHFDHIYAHEIQFTSPLDVYSRIPMHLLPVYHWINVGVNATPGDRFNPFTQLLLKYNEDDLIIVKLDIDTPSLEMSLAQQLLISHPQETQVNNGTSNNNNNSTSSTTDKVVDDSGPRLRRLIDQFYFEHHVHLSELAELWGEDTMQGSVKDTMELFYSLRKHGIPAHFWV